ncbi:MAG: transporter substrate-binding domain-containing protein [Undibacterium sp.]|nr:transporter substrate-binding domain-containing protein [Undibacterium sp.]
MIALRNFLYLICLVFFYQTAFAQNTTSSRLSLYCEEDKPMQFHDANKKLTGLAVEIVQEIQRRLGTKEIIQVVPWSRGFYKLSTEPNTFLFSMARTPEREHLYKWIGPLLSIEYGLYVKADSNIKIVNLEDAKKIGLIGVYRDDIRDQTLSRLGFTNLDRTSTNISSFRKLMIGRIAAYADAKKGVGISASNAGYQISDVKLAYDLFKSQLYIAVSKNTDAAIVTQWNDTLEEMKRDKSFYKLLKKYHEE